MKNPDEVKAILRKVTAYCPSMKMTEDTPLAWAEALMRFNVDDCMQAVANLGGAPLEPGKARYIEPGHVAWEVRRIRSKRVEGFDASMIDMPPGLTVREYQDRINLARELRADGRQLPQIEADRFTPERGSMREAIRGLIAAAHPKAVRDVA